MKDFIKTVKGKLCIAAAAVLLAAAAVFGGYQFWLYQQPKFQDVTIELGTTALGIDRFMTQYANLSKCSFASDISALDIGKAGAYELTLRHGNQEQTVTLTVQDTTAPEVTFLTERTEVSGYVPVPEDFVESCTDLSEVTFSFAEPLEEPEDLSDRSFTVVVADIHGNSVRQTCKLSYVWLQESVRIEYGTPLTKADVLLNPEKDDALVAQSAIDTINSNGIGEYTVRSRSGSASSSCLVTVEDTTGPVLVLQPVSVYVGKSVGQEAFVVSVEDLSGVKEVRMLTEPDFRAAGKQTLKFEAEDTWGNIITAEAVLTVTTDMEPPRLSGLYTMKVEKNSTPNYLSGVSATDAVDGTCQVRYDASQVNTSRPGTYYVTYTATDASGNTASSRRKVEVLHDAADTQALINEIAASHSSDPEALRDYVRSSISYSSSWGGDDPIWSGFKDKHGNCYVHAMCLNALLQYHGYNTKLIWVTDHSHYWLLIQLGGVWRHIDATPSTLHGRYSLMTDEQRYETLSGRDWDRTAWPACN